MSSVVSPASADEALEMLTAAMGYLAAADATVMTAEEQARCLRVLERATSVGTRRGPRSWARSAPARVTRRTPIRARGRG